MKPKCLSEHASEPFFAFCSFADLTQKLARLDDKIGIKPKVLLDSPTIRLELERGSYTISDH